MCTRFIMYVPKKCIIFKHCLDGTFSPSHFNLNLHLRSIHCWCLASGVTRQIATWGRSGKCHLPTPPKKKTNKEKKEQKTQKIGMLKEHSIEKWNILSPLWTLILIPNQHLCVNLFKIHCSTVINLQINSNQLVLRLSVNNTRMI